MTPARILSLWTPVAGFMGLLYFASSRSDPGGMPLGSDKLVHAVAYTVLGVLSLRAFHGGLRPLRWPATSGAVLLTLVYAALDELHQMRVPGRDASGLDWVADAVGALSAVVLVAAIVVLRFRFTARESEGGE